MFSEAIITLDQKIEESLKKLEENIKNFDYKALRSVAFKVENVDEVFTRTSDQAAKELISFFSDTFIYSEDKEIKSYFSELVSTGKKEQVIRLTNVLTQFKQHVQDAENNYFSKTPYGAFLAELRQNSSWVIHFHFLIEKYLDLMPEVSAVDYRKFIKNIQMLSEHCYHWIALYQPEQVKIYSTLRPAGSPLPSEAPAKRKADFLAFFKEVKETTPENTLNKIFQTEKEPKLASPEVSLPALNPG